jgi:membrane protein required for colicin V production
VNGLDIAVVAVIALSAIFAFARGFVREALSIIAWVGAALITYALFAQAKAFAIGFVQTPLLADLVAGAGLFIVSLIFLTIVTGVVAHSVRESPLSPIDRTLGLIFGLARGLVLVSLAYLVVDIAVPPTDRPGWVKEAKSETFLQQGADLVRRVLPERLRLETAGLAAGQRAAQQARQAQEAMDALVKPAAPSAKEAQNPAPVYKTGVRRGMDRLIQDQGQGSH